MKSIPPKPQRFVPSARSQAYKQRGRARRDRIAQQNRQLGGLTVYQCIYRRSEELGLSYLLFGARSPGKD